MSVYLSDIVPKSVTLHWSIENFDMLYQNGRNVFVSDYFDVEIFDNSQWRLKLYFFESRTFTSIIEMSDFPTRLKGIRMELKLSVIAFDDPSLSLTTTKTYFFGKELKSCEFDFNIVSDELLNQNGRFLLNGTLTVECRLRAVDEWLESADSKTRNTERDLMLLSADLKKMYETKLFSDFMLYADGEVFPVHQFIVASRRDTLALELMNRCEFSMFEKKCYCSLPTPVVKNLLLYLYTGKLGAVSHDAVPFLCEFKCESVPDLQQNITSPPVAYIQHTQLGWASKCFTWTLEHFSTFQKGMKKSICVNSRTATFEMSCSLTEGPSSEEVLQFCIRKFPGKAVRMECKISVVDEKGSAINVVDDSHLFTHRGRIFGGWDEWRLSSLVPKKMLTGESDLYLPNDNLSLLCDVSVPKCGRLIASFETAYELPSFVSYFHSLEGFEELSRDLNDFFSEGGTDFFDVTLHVGATNFGAHKAILCARSGFFYKMFTQNELQDDVTISNVSGETLKMMLEYMYSGKLEKLDCEKAMELYTAADQYEIPSLCEHCFRFIVSHIKKCTDFVQRQEYFSPQ